MYLSFFGLNEKPFAITPDPRYLYLSERHAEALAHLLYGINESGGFIQLTGEVGTGKTTVVRTLLSRVPHHADVAVILNPRVTPLEFLLTICEELGIDIAAFRGFFKLRGACCFTGGGSCVYHCAGHPTAATGIAGDEGSAERAAQ